MDVVALILFGVSVATVVISFDRLNKSGEELAVSHYDREGLYREHRRWRYIFIASILAALGILEWYPAPIPQWAKYILVVHLCGVAIAVLLFACVLHYNGKSCPRRHALFAFLLRKSFLYWVLPTGLIVALPKIFPAWLG